MPLAATDHERETMIRAYQSGMGLIASAALVGRSESACKSALLQRGIKLRTQGEARSRRFPEWLDSARQVYRDGATLEETAFIVGCKSGECLGAIFKRAGEPRRSRGESLRQYALNESFFLTIRKEEQAYWLGFISADGHVANNGLLLTLARKDKGHLESLKRSLGSDAPIRDHVTHASNGSLTPISSVGFFSVKMASDLRSLKLPGRKVDVLAPWEGPSGLLRHYWRGLFDGDGWISSADASQVGAALVGTKAIVEGFQQFVRKTTVATSRISPQRNTWRVDFGTLACVQALARLLYSHSRFYLPRKKERANGLLLRRLRNRWS
jgi:hypothetical protein